MQFNFLAWKKRPAKLKQHLQAKMIPKRKCVPPVHQNWMQQRMYINVYFGAICLYSTFRYKTMAGSSQYRFGVLAKIVKHMKTRHQDGDDHPLTIEEILDETNQLDIGQSVKNASLFVSSEQENKISNFLAVAGN